VAKGGDPPGGWGWTPRGAGVSVEALWRVIFFPGIV